MKLLLRRARCRTLVLLLASGALCGSCGESSSDEPEPQQDTPEGTVRALEEALKAGDRPAALALYAEPIRSLLERNPSDAAWAAYSAGAAVPARIGPAAISGEVATMTVERGSDAPYTYRLVREGETWVVAGPVPPLSDGALCNRLAGAVRAVPTTPRLPPGIAYAWEFSEGLALVLMGDESGPKGYVDRTGQIVIEPRFPDAGPFREGLARARGRGPSGEDRWGFIDKTGKFVIAPQYASATDFGEGRASFTSGNYGSWGFLDREGKVAIEPQFEYADRFADGVAPVMRDSRWSYIRADGAAAFAGEFQEASRFDHGLAVVVGEKSGVIDTTGKLLLEKKPDWLELHTVGSAEFVAFGTLEGVGLVRPDGTVVVPATSRLSTLRVFAGGLAALAQMDGMGGCHLLWGFVDPRGEWAIPPAFDAVSEFGEDWAAVTVGDRLAYVDRAGRIVLQPDLTSGENAFAQAHPELAAEVARFGTVLPGALPVALMDGVARVPAGRTVVGATAMNYYQAPGSGYVEANASVRWDAGDSSDLDLGLDAFLTTDFAGVHGGYFRYSIVVAANAATGPRHLRIVAAVNTSSAPIEFDLEILPPQPPASLAELAAVFAHLLHANQRIASGAGGYMPGPLSTTRPDGSEKSVAEMQAELDARVQKLNERGRQFAMWHAELVRVRTWFESGRKAADPDVRAATALLLDAMRG
ncbi:MAG: WG repeat-containing protein [Planctomycetes bacterium]|nr:WG repeat-containing protein [Planctomycetota bacterium]